MRTSTGVMSDNQLVKEFKKGNSDAFSILLKRYKDKIYSTIYYLVRDHWVAEDIFQEVFIRIIDTLRNKSYNEEGKFLPWALRIAHNLCIDYFRKQKRLAPAVTSSNEDWKDVFDHINNSEENREESIMRQQTYDKMYALIALLPAEQREVIVLRHFGDLSFKEIAHMTNCSINTALGRMRYGLINMRKMMSTHNIEL